MSQAVAQPAVPAALWWRAALPPLLYGLRFSAAVCLALFVAFKLELQNPSWAGTTAAIVCQPVLGASLRKASFRLVGTVMGAVFIVSLMACFPQSRVGFLVGLALWCGLCSYFTTVLRNFASYGAALAGLTASVVGMDAIADPDNVFTLALTRGTEIAIGIVAATAVLTGTELGGSRRELARRLGAAISDTLAGLLATLDLHQADSRSPRRALIGEVVALDPVVDAAVGEAIDLRLRRKALLAAMGGLFTALSGLRAVEDQLLSLDEAERHADAALIGAVLPQGWRRDGVADREGCAAAVRRLSTLRANSPGRRLLADRMAEALRGVLRAFDGLDLALVQGSLRRPPATPGHWTVADPLPPLINALRVAVAVCLSAFVWIATEWPTGTTFVTFVAITVLLMSPREGAVKVSIGFAVGTLIAACLAAATHFAFLVNVQTYAGFCLVTSAVMVPVAALSIVPALTPWLMAAAMNFIPLLGPTNMISYDGGPFLASVLAIVAGCMMGAVILAVIPSLSPRLRAYRLLLLTLRDVRRIAARRWLPLRDVWQKRVYARLAAMPQQASPLQLAQMVAALQVGEELLRLRRVARRFGLRPDLRTGLEALASGDIAGAIRGFSRFDAALAGVPAGLPGERLRLRARGSIRALLQVIDRHNAYFGARRGI